VDVGGVDDAGDEAVVLGEGVHGHE